MSVGKGKLPIAGGCGIGLDGDYITQYDQNIRGRAVQVLVGQGVEVVINLNFVSNGTNSIEVFGTPLSVELDKGILTDNNLLRSDGCLVRGPSSETGVSCLQSSC